jgi:hypothetical protein
MFIDADGCYPSLNSIFLLTIFSFFAVLLSASIVRWRVKSRENVFYALWQYSCWSGLYKGRETHLFGLAKAQFRIG